MGGVLLEGSALVGHSTRQARGKEGRNETRRQGRSCLSLQGDPYGCGKAAVVLINRSIDK